MYTGKTMKREGKYSYNVDKILNKAPEFCPSNDHFDQVGYVEASIFHLKETLESQLTRRQLEALEDAKVRLSYDFTPDELAGVIELRYEGAGSYRGGNSDDNYNSNKVSEVSIDFRDLGGPHNEDGFPEGYNDGYAYMEQ